MVDETHSDAMWKFAQTLSVIVGVVISALTFYLAQRHDTEARTQEAIAKQMELQKYADERQDKQLQQQVDAAAPFLNLRQKAYLEAVQNAAIIAESVDSKPEGSAESEEVKTARKRFRQLYIAELTMVEAKSVESAMMDLARAVDPTLIPLPPAQSAAYRLAHALRNSLVKSWRVDEAFVDNSN